VRVGRAPIDETAIRLLEQHNPDVEFDWTRILKAPPAVEGQRRDAREMRDRDQRGRREARPPQRPRSGGGPPPPHARPRDAEARPAAAEPARQEEPQPAEHEEHPAVAAQAEEYGEYAEPVPEAAAPANHTAPATPRTLPAEFAAFADFAAPSTQAPAREAPTAHEAHETLAAAFAAFAEPNRPAAGHAEDSELQQAESQAEEPFEDTTRPEPEVDAAEFRESADVGELGGADPDARDAGSASYVRLGAEGLVRLRARYAEVMARIAERPLEEAAREELKLRAERLNPDAWVTADEVTAALEQYETVFEGLRGVIGRYPRRRPRDRR
jgi:hypothetical protein